MISTAAGAIALVVAPWPSSTDWTSGGGGAALRGVPDPAQRSGVARLMRFIPRSVMVGFVNALAILIFTSQLPHLLGCPRSTGVPALVAFVAVGLIIMVFPPKLTTIVPAPLVAIVLLTAFAAIVFSCRSPRWETRASCPRAFRPCSSRRAVDLVDPDTHRALRAGDGVGGTAGVVVDGQAGR